MNPKIWRNLWRLINSFWAIPSLALLFIISKIIKLRIIQISADRIGHFLIESKYSYLLLKDKSPDETVLFWFDEPTSNSFWSRVVKRDLPVYQWINHLFYWNVRLGLNLTLFQNYHRETFSLNAVIRDNNSNFEKQPGLSFLPDEDDFAKNWLINKGWKEGEPFVCLLVRDSKYLSTSTFHSKWDWIYHSYRDSNIDDYLPAIKWLLEKEVWIIRMGKKMHKQVSIENKRLIDYPFCEDQDDLIDVWLFANCSLCISTLCGADFISDVYRRPILLINFLPLIHLLACNNITMSAPKKLLWANAGKELTLSEYLQNGFVSMSQYDEAGIKVQNLTPNEIYQIVKECWSNLEGDDQIPFSKNQGDFLRVFKNEISNNPKLAGFHRWFHPKLRMSEYWLNSKSTNFLS